MEILLEKFPKKADLVEALGELLCIERPAVYRRIRSDVPFTANEVAIMAAKWNISLDDLVGIYSGQVAFQMSPINYYQPSTQDIINLINVTDRLNELKDMTNSEYFVVCNNLARSLSAGFRTLYKFNVFKWGYEFSNEPNIPFANIVIPQEIQDIVTSYSRNMKDMGTTSIILDHFLFDNLVREILFFHSIMLITDEEKEMLKQDLIALMNYLLEIANTGAFPETKNKVYLYISTLNVNTNYSYMITDKFRVCRIHAFNKYDIMSYNPEMVENFKLWMHMKKRTSVLISEVDEQSRVAFFLKLQSLIESL
jgi:hypothetical protein